MISNEAYSTTTESSSPSLLDELDDDLAFCLVTPEQALGLTGSSCGPLYSKIYVSGMPFAVADQQQQAAQQQQARFPRALSVDDWAERMHATSRQSSRQHSFSRRRCSSEPSPSTPSDAPCSPRYAPVLATATVLSLLPDASLDSISPAASCACSTAFSCDSASPTPALSSACSSAAASEGGAWPATPSRCSSCSAVSGLTLTSTSAAANALAACRALRPAESCSGLSSIRSSFDLDRYSHGNGCNCECQCVMEDGACAGAASGSGCQLRKLRCADPHAADRPCSFWNGNSPSPCIARPLSPSQRQPQHGGILSADAPALPLPDFIQRGMSAGGAVTASELQCATPAIRYYLAQAQAASLDRASAGSSDQQPEAVLPAPCMPAPLPCAEAAAPSRQFVRKVVASLERAQHPLVTCHVTPYRSQAGSRKGRTLAQAPSAGASVSKPALPFVPVSSAQAKPVRRA